MEKRRAKNNKKSAKFAKLFLPFYINPCFGRENINKQGVHHFGKKFFSLKSFLLLSALAIAMSI